VTVPIFDPDLPGQARSGSRTRAKVTGVLDAGQVALDQTVGFAGGVVTHVGDDVLVDVIDGTATVTCNLTWWPVAGVVQSVDAVAGVVQVQVPGRRAGPAAMPVLIPFGQPAAWPQPGDTVVILDTPDGAVALGTTSTPLNPPAPTPGWTPGSPSAAVRLAAAAGWTMRSGSQRLDIPAGQLLQGHWTTGQSADNTGFTLIPGPAGMAGRPVTACRVSLTRSGSSHGASGPTAPVLRAHANTGPGPASWVGDPVTVGGLARGQAGTWDVPLTWAAGLADGSVTGIALVGAGVGSYFATDCATWSLEATYG
jgi:hypothetical protein